ncbi:SCO family protein [Methylocystis parvus]|uniref:Thioredoxin domain-containing protein n=1 Tax=Methylocystis parvus TaxID=134 RepID=A0A6B8M4S9_9HYPH|nr:SCO family protein [Methylocystis parvus]QGM96779.1 hypothetical protein F7D14_04355 [Methylocystis parvus]WBJ99345.1 SCO family protein [Methylocystis parvus OBBP]
MKRIAPLLTLLPALALAPAKAGAPPDLTGAGYTQRIGARLPLDIVLQDETGHGVKLAETLDRRPVVLLLGYFRCRKLCSVLRAETLEALLASGLSAERDYRFVVVSVDPSETSADAAAAKARDIENFPAAGASSGWRYLTAGNSEIAQLSRTVGFDYAFNAEQKTILHPIGRVLLDREGVVSGYLFGFGLDAATIREAIERARDRKTTRASPASLFCFDYDPETGRYSVAVLRLLRLLSVAGVLVFAGTLYKVLRRSLA